MAVVVPSDGLPVVYESWSEWRSQRPNRLPPVPLVDFCGYCWGQYRVYEAAPNGEGLVPRACPDCCPST